MPVHTHSLTFKNRFNAVLWLREKDQKHRWQTGRRSRTVWTDLNSMENEDDNQTVRNPHTKQLWTSFVPLTFTVAAEQGETTQILKIN